MSAAIPISSRPSRVTSASRRSSSTMRIRMPLIVRSTGVDSETTSRSVTGSCARLDAGGAQRLLARDLQREVQGGGGMRQRADADVVGAREGIGPRIVHLDAAAHLHNGAAADDLHRLANLAAGEVVEQDAWRLVGEGLLQLLEVAHLNVDLHVGVGLPHGSLRRADAADQRQV